ncbi:sensor histidine kinase [Azovibrio restrictus]|uniref:sensor histidine kinase n=1 Tax=Azovibrio restrictus TaxID=146938 RepID=UPI00040D0DEE|nr:ATP-binding protein [Azovibrio restrictus]
MNPPASLRRLGIRAKLILLFVLIKVIPLVLLALLAWEGVTHLGGQVSEETETLSQEVGSTVADMGKTFSREAEKALNDRAREELERLTTDTARAVADFLHDRDQDLLLAAQLEPTEKAYRDFLQHRTRKLVDQGQWELAADGKSWLPRQSRTVPYRRVEASNAENRQDFHYRPPEAVLRDRSAPLFHEITFVGLDGREKLKVSATNLLPRELRDVSKKENTYARAETYFTHLKNLKPGEIHVSDVIGPYVPSRIIGPVTPEKAKSLGLPYEPEKEAYAGRENPLGRRFQGIIRWATPVLRNGQITGYVTLALDHSHVMSFTDNLMPTDGRYTPIADATNGNYAFIWDYQDRSIAHPRHHSVVGFDPDTGEYAVPWLEASIHEGWQQSGKPLREYLAGVPPFDHQSRDKKPAKALTQAGQVGLECRYLNFAPQCQGWHDLTQFGGSGSFLILWTGVWKLTTAATIPYYTGHYGETPRGFGYVTIGANIDDFQKPAQNTARLMQQRVEEFATRMRERQAALRSLIETSMTRTAASLTGSTLLMIALVVAIAIWLASMLTRRITDLSAGLGRIEGGDYGFRFPHASDDELGQLNDALNRMADSVQESFTRLEQARQEAEQASLMKSDFLARMSHELRTPLNGILGFSELIKLDAPSEDIREQAQTIYQSGEHLLRLVNDILDLAKIESGHMTLEPEDMDLPRLLEEVAGLHRGAARQKGLELELDLEASLPTRLHGDATRLRQILNNLLNNAVKFTPAGQVTLAARSEAGRVLFLVEDTGPGIPQEAQAIIFEKFRQASSFITREHGGSGLGLALVRELVTLMGGEITLVSTPGAGARFEFWLPLA